MNKHENITRNDITELRKKTEKRIYNILTSPNLVTNPARPIYYVSSKGCDDADGKTPATAWASLERVGSAQLPVGAYVCFERGGIWRGQLIAQAGVTYTAYGEGVKPRLYVSPENGSQPAKWIATEKLHVWRWDGIERDVGTLVFNDGEACAIKRSIRAEGHSAMYCDIYGEEFHGYEDLKQDLHFWHDTDDAAHHALYLYSEENPGKRFRSIEFNVGFHNVLVKGDDVTIDNLCIKYGGTHGISAGTRRNLTVKNCEFGWIGGSYPIFDGERLGNAVQIYGGCDNYAVENCYFYHIYDAAVTHQYDLTLSERETQAVISMKHIRYTDNVMEYCNYSIEYFLNTGSEENQSYMTDFCIENNYMWYAGQGFCEQRPDRGQAAHIKSWNHPNRASDYRIVGNLLVFSKDMLVHIHSHCLNDDGSNSMPQMENNWFIGHSNQMFGIFGQDATERISLCRAEMDGVAMISEL